MLDLLYAQAARWRRRSMERHPERQQRLARPVISVGNLSIGGSGKTPVVAALAQWLVDAGERPAILSRGYARRTAVAGVVVVSDGRGARAGVDESGDEPSMLARAVPHAIVCVSADRHLAGTMAERTLGATVHVLDDGFQHLALARNLDVLVTAPGEIGGGRVLPFGRLREGADAASRADVAVVMGASADAARAEALLLGIHRACAATRVLGAPIATSGDGSATTVARDTPVLAITGIANPDRFVSDLRGSGWNVVRHVAFPDHHLFTPADITRLGAAFRDSGAEAAFTTDKDAVRFETRVPLPFPLYRVPMTLAFDPAAALFNGVAAMLVTVRRGAAAPVGELRP